MARYLIRQHPTDNCSMYSDLLKVENLPKTSPVSQHEPLRFKTYKETHCLIYPSSAFSNYGDTLLFHVWWCNAPK